ncbi:hypothetical protein, partial [Stenotrophomonas maltophilia]|uniref:hypothetical protein n=1 Tax=Stenotrophomonas maltophilia TaxID=40324 RepID=UPI0019536EA8
IGEWLNGWLVPCVIDFDPVSIGVLQPYLQDSIGSSGDGALFTRYIFPFEVEFFEFFCKSPYRGYAKANMIVLEIGFWGIGTLDN